MTSVQLARFEAELNRFHHFSDHLYVSNSWTILQTFLRMLQTIYVLRDHSTGSKIVTIHGHSLTMPSPRPFSKCLSSRNCTTDGSHRFEEESSDTECSHKPRPGANHLVRVETRGEGKGYHDDDGCGHGWVTFVVFERG